MSTIHNQGISPSSYTQGGESPQKTDKTTMQKALDGLKAVGAMVTNQLPFSSRSVLGQIARFPANFVKAVGQAKRENQGLEGALQNVKENIMAGWKGGIQDVPIEAKTLDLAKQNELSQKMDRYNGQSVSFENKAYTRDGPPELTAIKETLQELGFEKPKGSDTFIHSQSGTRLQLFCDTSAKPPEILIFFKPIGTSPKNDEGFMARACQIAGEFVGGITLATRQCITLGEKLGELQKGNPNIKITVSGHSHGGGLAQTTALSAGNDVKAYCYNSRPIGGATRNLLGDKVAQNADSVTHFCKKGDFLTGTRAINGLAAAWERVTGFQKSRNIGTVYNVPTQDATTKGPLQTHNDVSGWAAKGQLEAEITKNLYSAHLQGKAAKLL